VNVIDIDIDVDNVAALGGWLGAGRLGYGIGGAGAASSASAAATAQAAAAAKASASASAAARASAASRGGAVGSSSAAAAAAAGGSAGIYDYNIVSSGPLLVTSSSPLYPGGLYVTSENTLEGNVLVSGALPFLSAVGFEGSLPTAGSGAATCGCGVGNVGIINEL
jgi:hypothetical protein